MALNQNTLSFLLTAKADGVQKAFSDVAADAKKTAKGISDAFRTVDGDLALGDALEGANFAALVDQARVTAKDVKGVFQKAGEDLNQVFSAAKGPGLSQVFDGAGEAAKEMARQAELALESIVQEANVLQAELGAAFGEGAGKSKLLEATLKRLEAALAEVGTDGKKNIAAIEHALDEVKGAAKEAAAGSADLGNELAAINLDNLAQRAQDLAGRLSSLGAGFTEAGKKSRKVDQDLRKVFENQADVKTYSAAVRELAHQFEGLDPEELTEATANLDRFGVASVKNLTLLTNAAQTAKKSVGEVSEPFGEFMAAAANGGDFGAISELGKLLGVGAAKLKEFGAQVKDGKLLGDTPEQIKAANDALLRYLESNEKFSNVSQRSQDNIAKLSAEIDKFSTSAGEGANALKNQLAGAALDAAKGINGLSDETKGAIGVLTEGGSAVAGLGAKTIELGAFGLLAANQFKTLTAGMTLVVTEAQLAAAGMFAMGAGIVAAVAGIVLITKSAYDMGKAFTEARNAQESLLELEARVLESSQRRRDYALETVDAIRAETDAIEDAGKRREAITDAIIAKEAQADIERDRGGVKRAAFLKAEADALKRTRNEYDAQASAVVAAEQKKQKAEEDRYAAGKKAFEAYKKSVSGGLFDSQADQAKELKSLIPNLDGDALNEAKAQMKSLNASLLADEVNSLKERVTANKVSAKESEGILANLEVRYESHGDAKKAVDKEFTEFLKGEAEKRYQIQQQLLAKELEIKKSQLTNEKDAELAGIDAQIFALEGKIAKEKNVFEELKLQNAERGKALKSYADEEAALEKIAAKRQAATEIRAAKDDPETQVRIKEQLADQLLQIDQRLANARQQIDADTAAKFRAATEAQLKFKQEAAQKELAIEKQKAETKQAMLDDELAAAEYGFQRKREMLELEASLGKDVAAERQKLDDEYLKFQEANIQKRLALRLKEIEQERKAADIGAKPAAKAANAEREAVEIAKARREAQVEVQGVIDQSNAALVTQTQEIQKQIDLLKEQTAERKKAAGFDLGSTFATGAQSVEDAFSGNASGIGVGRRQKAEGGGPSLAELEAQKRRNLGILNSRKNRQGQTGTVGSTSTFQTSSTGGETPTPFNSTAGQTPTGPPPITSAQGDQMIQQLAAMVQAFQALAKRQPSSLGNDFARGRNRPDGTY